MGEVLRRPVVGSTLLLAMAGASAWISFGTLAVLDRSTLRVGALPPIWLLIVLVAAGAIVGWIWRPRSSTLSPLILTGLLWLPWLPVPVPAAFLLWSGPAELFVWMAAIAGVVAACAPMTLPVSLGRPLGDPRRAPVVALLVGLICSLAAVRTLGVRIPAGDEPHYLIITQSLLLDGDLRIENNHQRKDYAPYFDDLPRPDFLRRGVDGQIYSVHAPGLPALIAPAFAIGGYGGAVIFLVLLMSFGGALAWHAAWSVTGSAAAAWVGWIAVFFSAPVFFHVFTIYPDGAGAVCAMAAVWLLVRLDLALPRFQRGDVSAAPVSRRVLVLVSVALSLLPWLHSRFAIVAGGLGLVLLLRLLTKPDRWRNALAFSIVPIAAALAWFSFFQIVYGTFSPAAPYGNVVQNRLATLRPGLPGLFFDQQFGLVTSAPIFAVALIGLVALARRRPRLVAELVLVAVPYVLAVASYVMWWAGHSAPARFLTILLLPAAIPVAWLFHAVGAWARAAIGAAAVVGVLGVVLRTAVNAGLLVYNDRGGYDLLLDWLSPTVNLPLAFPSFHRDIVPAALGDVRIWTVALALALIVVWAALRWIGGSRSVAWTLTAAIFATTVMSASTIVWARYDPDRIITPASSQLAFLQEWDPAWHPVELQLEPLAALGYEDVLPRLELDTSSRGLTPSDPPLLYVPLVPAGEYELDVSGAARLAGTLEVLVGRSTQLIDRFDLTNHPAGATGLSLRLPVLVHSITIRADVTAKALVSHVRLRPRSIRAPAERLADTYARRASRYGSTRVFFLDEYPFMEVPGFWTAGAASTAVVVDTDEGAPPSFLMRAGAVPTTVTLRAGEWRADYDLAAGQAETAELPSPRVARALSIATDRSFTPAAFDPTSSDLRALGVWVEFPR